MAKIGTTEMRTPGDYWRIMMTKEELEYERCMVCDNKFEEMEEVYSCEVCNKIFHSSCVSDGYGNIVGSKFPCLHFTKNEYQYYCGKVVVEKWKDNLKLALVSFAPFAAKLWQKATGFVQ